MQWLPLNLLSVDISKKEGIGIMSDFAEGAKRKLTQWTRRGLYRTKRCGIMQRIKWKLKPVLSKLGVNAMTAVGDPTASGQGVEHSPPIIAFEVSDFEPGSPSHSKYAEEPIVMLGQWSKVH